MVGKPIRWSAALLGGVILMLAGVRAEAGRAWSRPDRILTDTAEASAAIAVFEARYALDPWNHVVGARLADRYMARFATAADVRDVERAEEIARRLVRDAHKKSTAHARLSQILLARHDFQGAHDSAIRSIEHDSTDAAGWAVLFDASMAIGDYERADRALSRLARGTLARQLRHARWLAFHGENEVAFQTLARACKDIRLSGLRPQVAAWCLVELSNLAVEPDGAKGSKRILALALQTQPEYRGALERLADLAVADRDWKTAADLYERIATDAHPDLFLRLSEVYVELGDTVRAIENETQFVEIARGAEQLHAHPLALLLARDEHTVDEAARIMYRDLARRQPVETYAVLAWVELQRNEVETAFEMSLRARGIGSPTPTMDYVHGAILSRMGRATEGRALLRRALKNAAVLEPHARRSLSTARRLAENETVISRYDVLADSAARASRSSGLFQ